VNITMSPPRRGNRWRDIRPIEVIHALECGANGFLTKPVEPERLVARVTSLLETRRLRTETPAVAGAAIVFGGQRFAIASEREQVLDLLVSTYEELARAHAALQQSHDTIRAQAELLRELSVRDELTGLHNLRYFNEHAAFAFAQARRYGQPLTLMMGDLDDFKRVNDRFSHTTGNEVLRQVARILQSSVRETDICARYGGEEFVIAFTDTSLDGALATCERIRRRIEEYPWHKIHAGLRVTITVGLDDEVGRESVGEMLAAADARMYAGKQAGRNQVCAANLTAIG
jgi:diguanylate cyclase (GGDEF)-like protein